jgi:hypothetical protein
MGNPAHVRNFESVLEALARRGHRLTVLFEERKPEADEAGLRSLGELGGEHGTVRWDLQPRTRLGPRGGLRTILEAAQDYLRFFEPPYTGADSLRARGVAFLPARLERALAAFVRSWPGGRRRLRAGLSRAAGRLGDAPGVRAELEARRPDVLIVTPLVQFRTRQRAWVRTARALGIRTVACVYSWDVLTNRGLMHSVPDRLAVWNDAQREQATRLHGIPEDRIMVAGAWPYDRWLGRRPSRSREELLGQLGVPADCATILYACSSPFIAAREREAVETWLHALRSAPDPRVASSNVIVRPHPLNRHEWDEGPVADPEVVVFPPQGAEPLDEPARADYFDSIAHADAVVGVNTSALIEATILDRPALSFPGPTFRSTQEELPHFRLLVGEPGAVMASASMEEHLMQLGEALSDPARDAQQRRRFVDTFIRPGGDSPSPTDRVVGAVEELLVRPRASARG